MRLQIDQPSRKGKSSLGSQTQERCTSQPWHSPENARSNSTVADTCKRKSMGMAKRFSAKASYCVLTTRAADEREHA
jgi:hypothetical protein